MMIIMKRKVVIIKTKLILTIPNLTCDDISIHRSRRNRQVNKGRSTASMLARTWWTADSKIRNRMRSLASTFRKIYQELISVEGINMYLFFLSSSSSSNLNIGSTEVKTLNSLSTPYIARSSMTHLSLLTFLAMIFYQISESVPLKHHQATFH